MFLFRHPTDSQIQEFLRTRKGDSFSYSEVGSTRGPAPPGYNIDHNRTILGHGEPTFERAKQAVRNWKMFDVPGMKLYNPDTPIEVGRDVAPLARHLGFYSLNSCRIVYVVDNSHQFGFAYGTLTEHAEIGEERFMVQFDRESGEVRYDIFAFSRPAHILVKLGYPYSRYRQKEFAAASKDAMRRSVIQNRER